MYVNGKVRPVEAILRIREGGIKENDGGGEFNYDLFDTRIFVNATMYPQHNNKKISSTTN
jgi:hypothetical protein